MFIDEYAAEQQIDVNTGRSLAYYSSTTQNLQKQTDLYSFYGELYKEIMDTSYANVVKNQTLNETTFYSMVYPMNGTAAWPIGGNTTIEQDEPWDGSAKTVLFFAICFFILAIMLVLYTILKWWRERGEEHHS